MELGFKELSPCSHLAGKDPVIPAFGFNWVFFCLLTWCLLAGSAKKPAHFRQGSPESTQQELEPLVNVTVCTTAQETPHRFSGCVGHIGEQCTNQALLPRLYEAEGCCVFYQYKRAQISQLVALVAIIKMILKLVPDILNNFFVINSLICSMRRTENLGYNLLGQQELCGYSCIYTGNRKARKCSASSIF